MPAYRKFSLVWQNDEEASAPPKPAKVPKADQVQAEVLGGLDALGGAEPKIENLASVVSLPDPIFDVWDDAEAERAAIVEHKGKIPREWAEGFARLNPDLPPGDVPPRRWQCFVDGVGLFLDSPFCAVAVALGWGPHDLFGCDRDRPFARIDQSGLLWLLNDNKLIALCEDAAGIQTPSGERLTYRRKPSGPGRVLAWELAS